MESSIDLRPLATEPDPAAVAAFRAAHRGERGYAASPLGLILIAVVGAVFGAFGFGMGLPDGIVPIIVGVVAVVLAIVGFASGGRGWRRMTRLAAFAAANGLVYSPAGGAPGYPGAIFGTGSERATKDRFRRAEPRELDYGNYQYTTGSGKSRSTHQWWYLAIRLDRALPHMVLDSRANNQLFGATNLPVTFAKDQELSLEGDFDRYFRLYCPREYERDALYVFTPDLMALCIDEAASFDLEIVDDWLFAYTSRSLDMGKPDVQQRVWRLIETVGSKTLSRTDRYADERAGGRAAFSSNIVAPQGARLRKGVPIAAIIVGTVAAVVFFLPQILRLLGVPF